MSLQVWLPFTDGTLKQQGLKNVSATIGGTINLTEAGKLGKCATIGTTAGGITLPASTMTSFTECSVAFWINITAWNTSWDTFFQAGLGSTPWNNYIFGILRNQGDYLCFTISNGSSTSSGGYASSNLTIGQWMHLTFTYSNKKCKIYINGALDKEYSTSIAPNFAGITHIAIGRSANGSNYQSKCKLNDFRIYDHCLSPMEVKQISQGLVLHYPLNREGWGQENLLLNSTIPISGPGAAGVTKSITEDGLQKVVAVSGNSNWCTFNNHNTTLNLTKGDTFTFSLMIKSDDSTKKPTVYFQNGLGYYDMQGTMSTNWSIIYYTGVWNIDNLTTNIHLGFSAAPGTYYIKYFKIEKGDKITPWAPNHTDDLYTTLSLDEATEYDCSGFCNNGTRTGTFDWTSDTPKYQISTKFNTNYIERDNLINNPSSTAFWIKFDSLSNQIVFVDYNTVAGLGIYNNNLLIGYGADCKLTYPKTIINTDIWYHICIVKASNSTAQFYLNGNLQTPGSTSDYWTKVGTISQIGARSTNYYFKGNLSDFRIYATALSADDVRALYENSAYIDNSSNTYAATYTEV